jgi:hypothetical protein
MDWKIPGWRTHEKSSAIVVSLEAGMDMCCCWCRWPLQRQQGGRGGGTGRRPSQKAREGGDGGAISAGVGWAPLLPVLRGDGAPEVCWWVGSGAHTWGFTIFFHFKSTTFAFFKNRSGSNLKCLIDWAGVVFPKIALDHITSNIWMLIKNIKYWLITFHS